MPLDGVIPFHDRIVPSVPPVAPFCGLAFVGEAPGAEEVDRLRPFVGPSGRVFDALLRSAGIDRAACWVGNVLSTKLEDNDLRKEKERRGPAWGEHWQSNISRLHSELSAIQPTVTVALGGTALLALAGTTSVAQFRGQPRMGTGLFSTFKVFPTWHPAFLLRSWDSRNTALGDLLRVKIELEKGPGLVWPERVLNIAPSIEEVERAAEEWQVGDGPLSCDIETGWGQIRGIAFAPSSREALYCPFISLAALDRNYWPSHALEARAWAACKRLLECPRPKLGQNFANYDIIWLLGKAGIRPRAYCHDLRLLHKALWPELPAGLAFMGAAHSDQGAWKAWAKHGGSKVERGEKRDE
jgi:DNA polymerase